MKVDNLIRIYNLFSQIQLFLNKNIKYRGIGLLKEVFKVEKVEDVIFLKDYIEEQFELCKEEMLNLGYLNEDYELYVLELKKFLDNSIFIEPELYTSFNGQLTKDWYTNLVFNEIKLKFPSTTLKEFKHIIFRDVNEFQKRNELDIKEIQEKRQGLREKIITQEKRDYVDNFILKNLEKMDIIIKNFDKISIIYTIRPLSEIMGEAYLFEKKELNQEIIQLAKKIEDYSKKGYTAYRIIKGIEVIQSFLTD